MCLTETKNKLNEARYFLNQMKMALSNPEILGYNLSAFVSAARSVTLVMQKECRGYLRFKRWYESKQKEMKNDSIFNFFNKLRRYTIHINSIRMKREISVHINEPPISVFESITVKVTRNGKVLQYSSSPLTDSTLPKRGSNVGSTQEIKMHFEEKPQEDGIELCERHLKRIEQLVAECAQIVNSGLLRGDGRQS